MKWSEKDFRAHVATHASRQGLTLTEVLLRAGLTEDYLRRKPAKGRNIAGILQIAEALEVNPAELMGLEFSTRERRSMTTMIAHVMAHMHFNMSQPSGELCVPDVEKIVVAVMAALNEEPRPPKTRTPPAAPTKSKQ